LRVINRAILVCHPTEAGIKLLPDEKNIFFDALIANIGTIAKQQRIHDIREYAANPAQIDQFEKGLAAYNK